MKIKVFLFVLVAFGMKLVFFSSEGANEVAIGHNDGQTIEQVEMTKMKSKKHTKKSQVHIVSRKEKQSSLKKILKNKEKLETVAMVDEVNNFNDLFSDPKEKEKFMQELRDEFLKKDLGLSQREIRQIEETEKEGDEFFFNNLAEITNKRDLEMKVDEKELKTFDDDVTNAIGEIIGKEKAKLYQEFVADMSVF